MLLLIIQLLPSLTITALNFIVPLIFNGLVSLEDYWPAFELKITLIRSVSSSLVIVDMAHLAGHNLQMCWLDNVIVNMAYTSRSSGAI